jgi:hypothetical protein
MAIKAKIAVVTSTVNVTDGSGNVIGTRDLSLEGKFSVTAQYYDDANPAVILHTKDFEFPYSIITVQAQQAVIDEGSRVKGARMRVAQLQSAIGAVIDIP